MNYLNIVLPASDGKNYQLTDFAGKKVVLYFYPKDNTSGCTMEAIEFTRLQNEYHSLGYTILGVSRDSVKSHCNFIEKQDLSILLLSDEQELLCNAFGVMKEKSMYGRTYLGVERSTFVLNESGAIVHEERGVNASKHPQELLDLLKKAA